MLNNITKSVQYLIRISLGIVLFICVISITGCGTTPYYESFNDKNLKVEVQSTEQLIANDLYAMIDLIELKPNYEINSIDYDESSNMLVLDLKNENLHKLVIYDLTNKKITNTAISNSGLNFIRKNYFVLKNNLLINTTTGNQIREIEPASILIDDSTIISASFESTSKRNLISGQEIWSVPGYYFSSDKKYFVKEEKILIVDEGLYSFNLSNGKSWGYETSTSNSNAEEVFIANMGLSCLAGAAGTTNTTKLQADKISSMYADPLVEAKSVFFAARDQIFCFDLDSGKTIWQQNYIPEMERMRLFNFSKDEILLIGMGYRIFNDKIEASTEAPAMLLFDKNSGQLKKRVDLNKNDLVLEFIKDSSNAQSYLLLANQIQIFDANLDLIAKIEKDLNLGRFIKILDSKDALILRTSNGILALDLKSYEQKWYKSCQLDVKSDRGLEIIGSQLTSLIYKLSELNTGMKYRNMYFGFDALNRMFKVYNLESWEEIANINLEGFDGEWENKAFYGSKDNQVILIRLKEGKRQ